MGKKKSKKAVAEATPKLSKAERKALRAEAERIERELAERKAAKKAAKKGKGKEAARPEPTKAERKVAAQVADAKAERDRKRAEKAASPEPTATHEKRAGKAVLKKSKAKADLDATLAEHDAAIAEKSTPEGREDIDAAIKARVQAKRAARESGEAETPGSPERLQAMADAVAEGRAERVKKAKAAHPEDAEKIDAAIAAVETPHVAEVVETDHGREIAVGPADAATDFAQPSEAPKTFEENVNGLGQYKVARPTDGKVVGYTRWTTYIDCLEDKKALEKWKARILLEGVAAIESEYDRDQTVVQRVNDLVHRRDVAIAKARKADRKGKLGVGELATYVDGAWADFKKALDTLADEVFEVGGGREKATKGTDIHALCDLAERDGIGAVGDLLTAGEITPADLADVEAYLDAIRRLGAKPVLAEQVVVNDELKVAGRLDRVYIVKLPGEARGRRRVVDLKTGRIDYGTGKIAQQIEGYAGSEAYDETTHERTPLGVDRTLGLVIHLPAGTGKATVHRVDLSLGRKGNKLAGEVRAWRNEGKRAIDLKADVLEEIAQATDVDAMKGGE